MGKHPETLFKERVKRLLDAIPGSFWIKIQLLSLRGIPDFLGVYRGRFIALELKVGKNKLDQLQIWTMEKIRNCGGLAFEVRPENLELILAEIKSLT